MPKRLIFAFCFSFASTIGLRLYLQSLGLVGPYDFREVFMTLQTIAFAFLVIFHLLPPVPENKLKAIRSKLLSKLKHDEKAIVTVIGFLLFLVVLIIFAYTSPVLIDCINKASGYLNDPFSPYILGLLPAMFLIGIVVSYLIYAGAGK